ncbi:Rho GTPase activating protein [Coemansia sp. RSA 1807]|nr:Rho GTPase activating protein [Coemansia sp. RSA 1807]
MTMPGSDVVRGDSVYQLDGDIDVILILQERDAYKQETEKLRKIIERQRFIIKSLQDQISRKQSSTTTTPSVRNSELSPEFAERALQDPVPDSLQPNAGNALGLSALTVSSLPQAVPSARKASQGSVGGIPQMSLDEPMAEPRPTQTNARPWVKSTRLSEIYADYSARHNSTAPMFKPAVAAWAANSDAAAQQTGGNSFIDSLKATLSSHQEAQGDQDYSSDPSSGGRISSPVLESSREQSVSIDVGEREGLRAAIMNQPKHAPAMPQFASPPDTNAKGTSADLAKPAAHSSYANDGRSMPVSNVAPSHGTNLVSPSGQSGSEHIVMRPISMGTDPFNVHSPKSNGMPHNAQAAAGDDYQWQDSIADYEYGGSEGTMPKNMQSQAKDQHGRSQGLPVPVTSVPPAELPRRPSDYSLLHEAGAGVRWTPEMPVPALGPTSNNPFMRKDSNSSTVSSSSHARAHSGNTVDHGMSIYSDLPQGPSSVYSTASLAKAPPPGSPLTSLQNVSIQIKDSRVKIDERGKEVNVYMIDVVWRKEISGMSLQEILLESQQSETLLWTVEKRYSDFLNLNSKLRHVIHRERLLDKLERLPDKDIFRPNAPTKTDKRKLWFERYLQKALTLAVSDKRPLLEFLSSDRSTEPEQKMPILLGHKEGFLVKKGKNFGGWKRRYYVCKSNKPVLEYSELPGGAIIGTINLSGAVVKTGKSRAEDSPSLRTRSNSSKDTDMFRHAFLIEERAKREGKEPTAHPLWADSDRERDEWVMALRYVIVRESDGPERAMREVTKLVKHAKSKEAKPLMIHQIHTSINHEHDVRRSIEQARRKEEDQRGNAAAASSTAGKFGSPLSKQMWPITGSLDNMAKLTTLTNANELEADSDSVIEQLYNSSRGADRPRSVSLPPTQDNLPGSPAHARTDTGVISARASPATMAASLSTSFAGYSDPITPNQADSSMQRAPSVISTIESSIYSSYNGNNDSIRPNDISSRSIGDRNSYSSMPDSPLSATRPTASTNTGKLDMSAAISAKLDMSSTNTPPMDTLPVARAVPKSEPPMHKPNLSVSATGKAQFMRNSIGRIVHEEEAEPDLPEVTPRVTDDILGVGRTESFNSDKRSGSGSAGSSSGGRPRTREDKKRGRITFMWGKRKPAENDHPMPDLSAGNNSGSHESTPPVAPRRLRRGSTSNDRHVLTKNPPFRGPVFRQPLERAVELTKVRDNYHLPAVVYRCIEFLDAKKAWLEEGIYRQSGSTSALHQLRSDFDNSRDYNLLKLSKQPDVHVVASLLKAYLRDLPEIILTARLCQDFLRVVDLTDRHDRVCELGRLVSELPLANYTLLRALTAHLIRIVQRASTNRMTLRNIGIVFSPSLGIPVGVFSLLMIEFEYIFWVNDDGVPEPRPLAPNSMDDADDSAHMAQSHEHGSHMSASVPTGINQVRVEKRVPAGIAGITNASLSSGSTAYAVHPGANGSAAPSQHVPAPWYGDMDSEVVGGGGAISQDLSRYPGMPSSQSTGRQQGRSNRNSIQYKVGAPRELISQEVGISIPATIAEDDLDDDSDELISASDDPMMQLNRYASSSMLRANDNPSPRH